MVDSDTSVTLDFSDGFMEGYLTGMMLGASGGLPACDRPDCPRED